MDQEKCDNIDSNGAGIIQEVYGVVKDREKNPVEGSYTNYLLDKGIDYILKKVGEECVETIIACKNNQLDELVNEAADLLYHFVVMCAAAPISLEEVFAEMRERRQSDAPDN